MCYSDHFLVVIRPQENILSLENSTKCDKLVRKKSVFSMNEVMTYYCGNKSKKESVPNEKST